MTNQRKSNVSKDLLDSEEDKDDLSLNTGLSDRMKAMASRQKRPKASFKLSSTKNPTKRIEPSAALDSDSSSSVSLKHATSSKAASRFEAVMTALSDDSLD